MDNEIKPAADRGNSFEFYDDDRLGWPFVVLIWVVIALPSWVFFGVLCKLLWRLFMLGWNFA